MFANLISKWRLKQATKQMELEKLHIQELCDHEWEYAGKKVYEGYDGVEVCFDRYYVAVCKHCDKEIKNRVKDNIDTTIAISKIRHSKEN